MMIFTHGFNKRCKDLHVVFATILFVALVWCHTAFCLQILRLSQIVAYI